MAYCTNDNWDHPTQHTHITTHYQTCLIPQTWSTHKVKKQQAEKKNQGQTTNTKHMRLMEGSPQDSKQGIPFMGFGYEPRTGSSLVKWAKLQDGYTAQTAR